MLKIKESLSDIGVLDIYTIRDTRAAIPATLEDDGPVWKDLGITVVSIDVNDRVICDVGIVGEVTEEKIIEAVYHAKSRYITSNSPYQLVGLDRNLPEMFTLPTGTISMSQVNTEFGRAPTTRFTLNDSDVRTLAQRPSGSISLGDLRGKSRDYWVETGVARWENAEITWWIPTSTSWNVATIRFTGGAALHSTSTNIYALHVRNVPANLIQLEFMAGSRCVGKGGFGGNGGSSGKVQATNGKPGGPAIFKGQNLSVINHGATIAGGGGGGGGGGYASDSLIAGGGGGGGAGGGGPGTGGNSAGSPYAHAHNGASGSDLGAGGGGKGGYLDYDPNGQLGGVGGWGGGPGQVGGVGGWGKGGACSQPGSGGAPGILGYSLNREKSTEVMYVYENKDRHKIIVWAPGAGGMPGEVCVGDPSIPFKMINVK